MKPASNHQEILIMTGSSFAHRQWADRMGNEEQGLTDVENLERACWNGLVKELLPELDPENLFGRKLWLWQVVETNSFLELELSDYPSPKDKWTSLDPYSFLETKSAN